MPESLSLMKEEIDYISSYTGRTVRLPTSHTRNNRWHSCCHALLGVLPCNQLSFQFTVQMLQQTLGRENVKLLIKTFLYYPSEFHQPPA